MTNPLLTDPYQRRMAALMLRRARGSVQTWRSKEALYKELGNHHLILAYRGLASVGLSRIGGMREMLHALCS